MNHDLICVGLTTLDILGRPINQIPEGGKTELIEQIRLTPAGTAAGPAVIAAKMGLETALVAAIGEDDMGAFVKDAMERQGVDVSMIQQRNDMPTSATILTVGSSGERPNFHAVGAAIMVDMDDATQKKLNNSRYVHWGAGAMLCLDGERGAEILKEAKENGAIITCDFISPGPHTLPALEPVMPYVDYFMPSMEEAMEIAGTETPEETAQFFLDRGAKAVVFKWGSKGSLYVDRDKQFRVPCFKVDVVDTTGCGDSYCAGFVVALSKGWDVEKACRFASATAGLVASGMGSDAGVVDFEETVKAMDTLPVLETE